MDLRQKDKLITEYMPFIIKVVADYTKRYVELENSEELSIALEAINLALDKYDEERGSFCSYAKKVIVNKLIDEARKRPKVIKLEFQDSDVGAYEDFENSTLLKNEIHHYEKCLKDFDIGFEELVEKSPKHQSTRMNVLELGIRISRNQEMVDKIFKAKRLPITEISASFDVTKKILKSHKSFIVAIVIAYSQNFNSVTEWIETALEGSIKR